MHLPGGLISFILNSILSLLESLLLYVTFISFVNLILQLLDTGFFHADPHPGNLIRTPDGKLAILDFGN